MSTSGESKDLTHWVKAESSVDALLRRCVPAVSINPLTPNTIIAKVTSAEVSHRHRPKCDEVWYKHKRILRDRDIITRYDYQLAAKLPYPQLLSAGQTMLLITSAPAYPTSSTMVKKSMDMRPRRGDAALRTFN